LPVSIFNFKKVHLWLFAGFAAFALANNAVAQDDASTDSGTSTDFSTDLLHWKMFSLRPHAALSATYDDNINLRETNAQSDVIYTISPGFTLLAGDPLLGDERTMSIDYTASVLKFTDHSEFDAVDHAAFFSGVLPFAKLALGATASYEKISTPEIELGQRVDRSSYGAALTARYDYSPKTSFEMSFGYQQTDYPDRRYISSRNWQNQDFIDYHFSPKLSLGLGGTFGILEQSRGPSETYEQFLLRAIYTLTAKLDVNASFGGEFRQYDSFSTETLQLVQNGSDLVLTNVNVPTKASSSFGPVFTIGANYTPREGTKIHLDAHRADQNSAILGGQNYTSTGLNLLFSQQFLERFTASFGGNYNINSYHLGANTRITKREDSYWGVNAGLDVAITAHWTAGLWVLHRSGDSSETYGTVFDNNQVSLQTSYKF
jgi:hypothetical protein